MSECTHDCSSCSQDCSSRVPEPATPTADTKIKKIIAILSGKGGVGKSMVTSMMAVSLAEEGGGGRKGGSGQNLGVLQHC